MTYKEQLDMNRIPKHVAIIMDGNGRWAKERGLSRSAGHVQGVDTVRRVTSEAVRIGIKYLTLYTFSTENWNRPEEEVKALMNLILDSLEEEIFVKNHVRLRVIGDMSRLPQAVIDRLNQCMNDTAGFDRMSMVLALSYSSRWEITEAAKKMAQRVENGEMKASDITEEAMSKAMTTNFMPDPELLIRTGGEVRLSNYLLWQCAYSELYFCDTFWPDFDEEQLCKAIVHYQGRERRFGKTSEQVEEK
jgi:undecaprenyl diphosphate synthase